MTNKANQKEWNVNWNLNPRRLKFILPLISYPSFLYLTNQSMPHIVPKVNFLKNAGLFLKFLKILYKSDTACRRAKFAWQELFNFNLSLIFAQLSTVLLGLSLSNCRHLQCQYFKNTELNFFHSHVAVTVGQQATTLSYIVKLTCINLVTSSYIII